MFASISGFGLILAIVLLYWFRKPTKVILNSIENNAQKLDPILSAGATAAAVSAVTACEMHIKETEEQLKEAGITDSVEDLLAKYSTSKKRKVNS